jgi:hypothetical protein
VIGQLVPSYAGMDVDSNLVVNRFKREYSWRLRDRKLGEIAFNKQLLLEQVSDSQILTVQNSWLHHPPILSHENSQAVVTNSELCELCNGITIVALESSSGYDHHKSGRDLLRSLDISSPCPLCGLLLEAMRDAYLSPDWDDKEKQLDFIHAMEQDSEQINLTGYFRHKIEIRHDSPAMWKHRLSEVERKEALLALYTRHGK